MYLYDLQWYSSSLVQSLASLLTDLRTEGVILVLTVVELVFKAFPIEGPRMFTTMLPDIIQSILNQDVSTLSTHPNSREIIVVKTEFSWWSNVSRCSHIG